MTLPLSDIRVVDFATMLAAPYAGSLLGELGAEVVKVEPLAGEAGRQSMLPIPGTDGLSFGFITGNRSKRSVAIDITKPMGRDLSYDLVRWADVAIINMRQGTRQRYGFTYEDLAVVNPRLIYASVTALGEEGPDADLPGYDVMVQARAGDLEGRRLGDGPPPPPSALIHFDMGTGLLTFTAVLLALRERERTGLGLKVATSLLHTALALQARQMMRIEGSDLAHPAKQPGTAANYLCGDGRYIYTTYEGDQWEAFCLCVGLDTLLEDARFSSAESRTKHVTELQAILAHHLATRPAAEWEDMLKAVALGATVVRSCRETLDDPQVIANQMMTSFYQPGVGRIESVTAPFKLSSMPVTEFNVSRGAPFRGEDTDEVLLELGLTPEAIAALRAERVIG